MFDCRQWLCAVLLGATATGIQACDLIISPAQIDFGRFNRTTLKAVGDQLYMPVRRFSAQLRCESEQDLSLEFQAMALGQQAYRLGDQGGYSLLLHNAVLDGRAVDLTRLSSTVQPPQSSGAQLLLPGQWVAPARRNAVLRGKQLSVQVEVRAWASPGVLQAGDAVLWQDHGTVRGAGAQREVQLQVAFAPAACTPTLSQGGRLDFGTIRAQSLNRDKPTVISKSLGLSVSCDAPTRFALRATDNRAGSASTDVGGQPGSLFGIGSSRAGHSLGGFTMRLEEPLARNNSRPVAVLGSAAAQGWLRTEAPRLYHDGRLLGFGAAECPELGPQPLDGLSLILGVDLHLAPTNRLNLTEETAIDGAATLEIVYL